MTRLLATSLLALTLAAPAALADDEIGLIVSGVVDKWNGVQFIDSGRFGDDTVLASGVSGRLSLPLGTNLSLQSDVRFEYNDFAFDSRGTPGPAYNFQGAAHLSWRDPASFLFGAFGGAGSVRANGPAGGFSQPYGFVGAEAQFYIDNITLYAQGGFAEFDRAGRGTAEDAVFGRGVLRWFLDNNSRLQLEGTYASFSRWRSSDTEAFQVGARYDFVFPNLPLVGDLPLYVGYRGTFRNDCAGRRNVADVSDHTVMIGTSYSFSGSPFNIDRNGATLDTPDLGNMSVCHGFRGGGGGGGGMGGGGGNNGGGNQIDPGGA